MLDVRRPHLRPFTNVGIHDVSAPVHITSASLANAFRTCSPWTGSRRAAAMALGESRRGSGSGGGSWSGIAPSSARIGTTAGCRVHEVSTCSGSVEAANSSSRARRGRRGMASTLGSRCRRVYYGVQAILRSEQLFALARVRSSLGPGRVTRSSFQPASLCAPSPLFARPGDAMTRMTIFPLLLWCCRSRNNRPGRCFHKRLQTRPHRFG